MYRIEGDPSSRTYSCNCLLTLQVETAGLQLQGFDVCLAAVTLCHSSDWHIRDPGVNLKEGGGMNKTAGALQVRYLL